MFLIGATIFLLFVILLSRPAIRLISSPLNANHPWTAQLLRISLWIAVLSVVTWPVVLGPLLFKLNCSYFTKFQAKPIIDARVTGYIDERLSVSEYVENHMDGLFLNKDVEDLVAGRIAFFEMKKLEMVHLMKARCLTCDTVLWKLALQNARLKFLVLLTDKGYW